MNHDSGFASLFLPLGYPLVAGKGVAVATGVVAAGVVGLDAESGGIDSEASKVVANLVAGAVLEHCQYHDNKESVWWRS
jgi:hypothetical protein